jgi:hypothetical protein
VLKFKNKFGSLRVKRHLARKRFSSDDEVRNATAAVLKEMSQNSLFRVFELFKKRKKCIKCEGRYFLKGKLVGPVGSSYCE